jgi:hypothetical protein
LENPRENYLEMNLDLQKEILRESQKERHWGHQKEMR